jgi:hypothetical protein
MLISTLLGFLVRHAEQVLGEGSSEEDPSVLGEVSVVYDRAWDSFVLAHRRTRYVAPWTHHIKSD